MVLYSNLLLPPLPAYTTYIKNRDRGHLVVVVVQGEGMELPATAGLEYLASKPCEIFTVAKAIPQSLSLSTLVTMEMLKALR